MGILDQVADRIAAPGGGAQGMTADGTPIPLKDRIGFLERMYDRGANSYNSLHRQWYEDILWLIGEQYLEYDGRWGRFINRPNRSEVPRATANFILDAVERGASYLDKSLGPGHVVPEDSSTDAYKQALAADRINQRLWKDDHMGLKRRIATIWCVATGNALFLTGLDATSGKRPFQLPPELVGEGESGEIRLTDVCTEAINPMEIILDFHARAPWEVRVFLHHRMEDIDSLVDQFGRKARAVKPERDTSMNQFYQHKLMDLISRSSSGAGGYYGLASSIGDVNVENAAVVKTLYRLPSTNWPQGELLVMAGGEVLEDGPYPFIDEDGTAHPCLHHLRWHVSPGVPWGFGEVRNLRDPQRRINGMLTQAALARKTMGNPRWLAARGQNFDPEGSSRPGKVHLFSIKGVHKGFIPKELAPMGVGGDLWRELDQARNDFDRISGQNDVLRGENPTGVTAGVSLELLSERASGRYGPAVEEAKEVMRELQEFRLWLVKDSTAWMLGKRLLIRDEDGAPESVELSSFDLPKNPRIEMEAVITPLWSNAAKRANAERAAGMGLVDMNVPANRRKMRDLLGVADFEDAVTSDVRLAEFENQQLIRGLAVETREYEDSRIHMGIHRRLKLRPDYDSLPVQIKAVIDDHLMATRERVKQIVEDELAANEPTELPAEQGPSDQGGGPNQTEGAGEQEAQA